MQNTNKKSHSEEYRPLVSIVIPVYNGDPFLKDAIDSCLAQTYPNIEIIVVNDGSRDNGKTEEIAYSYGDKIRYYQKPNGGVSSALNYGIAQMKGEWFSWLSHDDIYEPEKIAAQIGAAALLADKCCVIRCETSLINEVGEPVFRVQKRVGGRFSGMQMMKQHYFRGVSLYGCCLLIHKRILDECGPFDTQMRTIQDEAYWWNIMQRNYSFISINDPLVRIRVHRNQMTKVLQDRFPIERKMMSDHVRKLYVREPSIYQKSAELYLYKQLKEGYLSAVASLHKSILDLSEKRMLIRLKCFFYNSLGVIYRCIKSVYRKVYKPLK